MPGSEGGVPSSRTARFAGHRVSLQEIKRSLQAIGSKTIDSPAAADAVIIAVEILCLLILVHILSPWLSRGPSPPPQILVKKYTKNSLLLIILNLILIILIAVERGRNGGGERERESCL